MNQQIEQYAKKILDGQLLERDQIDELSRLSTDHIDDMLYWANEIRKAGFESFRQTVTPRPGFPQALSVILKTPEQIRAESIQHEIQGDELTRA